MAGDALAANSSVQLAGVRIFVGVTCAHLQTWQQELEQRSQASCSRLGTEILTEEPISSRSIVRFLVLVMIGLEKAPEQTQALRAKTLGASSVAGALGLSQYREATPLADWMKRQPDYEPTASTVPMMMGHATEPLNRDLYASRLCQDWRVIIPDQQTHPDYEWLTCHPDGFVVDEFGSVRWGFEAKWTTVQHYKTDFPVDWFVQCQISMAICGLDRWDLSILVPGASDVVTHTIEADPDYIATLVVLAGNYWRDHVVAGVRPEAEPVDLALLARVPNESAALAEADQDTEEKARKHAGLLAQIKDLQADADALKLDLAERIGAHGGVVGDFGKIYFKAGSRRITDWRSIALLYEPPRDLVAHFTEEKPTARAFKTYYKEAGEDDQGKLD